MRIALITPWPPQHTGIADYAFDLARNFIHHGHVVDVYTQVSKPRHLNGVNFYFVKDAEIPNLSNYDNIIYQIGNNTAFHLFMLPILREYRGVVHLHDLVLHHLMAWLTWLQGDIKAYLDLITKWYGSIVAGYAAEMLKLDVMPWDSPVVTDIPLFEEVVHYADLCIVHSDFAKNAIRFAFPNLQCLQVPQVYSGIKISHKHPKTDENLRIGVFGGVDPQKHVDTIIRVTGELIKSGYTCNVDVVGPISKQCHHINNLVSELHVQKHITIHGRVDEETFNYLMDQCDICVSLRYPTMGETSAVVMKAIQKAIPIIVTNIGWYSELPDFVIKIPFDKLIEHRLKYALKQFIDDRDSLFIIKTKSIEYAHSCLNPEDIIDNYIGFLNNSICKKKGRLIFEKKIYSNLASVMCDAQITTTHFNDKLLLDRILKSIEICL